MAIKFYCDSCQKQIEDMNEIANFKMQENNIILAKGQNQNQVKVSEFIFCGDCSRKIREFFQKPKVIGGK
tara:strand:+ start:1255 stop:1464 length:210 start_codon:yes stop_codon:yes gene_type:complete